MAIADWPRKRKATLSWQHLSARVADSGERWTSAARAKAWPKIITAIQGQRAGIP